MSNENSSRDSLGDRMKSYEALSTSRQLMPNTPVYARIDGRAFHTFCHGLKKPYSDAFIEVMQEVCKFLVEATNACLGYVQSDEISLGWENTVKAPFDGRIQKLESNLSSLASARFVYHLCSLWFNSIGGTEVGLKGEDAVFAKDIKTLVNRMHNGAIPSFDCRVFNVPSMVELTNCFLWRENDAIKNSISGMALNFYSHKELQNKNSDEKIHMMRMKGYCFWEDADPAFMRGTFFRRELYFKPLTNEEVENIPEKQRERLYYGGDKSHGTSVMSLPNGDDFRLKHGVYYCMRNHVVPMDIPFRLSEIKSLDDALFGSYKWAKCKTNNPTFDLRKRAGDSANE